MFEDFLKIGCGGVLVYYLSCFKEYDEFRLNLIISDIESVYGCCLIMLVYGCGKIDYLENLLNYILGGRNFLVLFFVFN